MRNSGLNGINSEFTHLRFWDTNFGVTSFDSQAVRLFRPLTDLPFYAIITPMENEEKSKYFLVVHNTHCCKRCGCKYGDEDCPVKTGLVQGLSQCEFCENLLVESVRAFARLTIEEKKEFMKWVGEIDSGKSVTCPRCLKLYSEQEYKSEKTIGVDECNNCEDEWTDTHNSFFSF